MPWWSGLPARAISWAGDVRRMSGTACPPRPPMRATACSRSSPGAPGPSHTACTRRRTPQRFAHGVAAVDDSGARGERAGRGAAGAALSARCPPAGPGERPPGSRGPRSKEGPPWRGPVTGALRREPGRAQRRPAPAAPAAPSRCAVPGRCAAYLMGTTLKPSAASRTS